MLGTLAHRLGARGHGIVAAQRESGADPVAVDGRPSEVIVRPRWGVIAPRLVDRRSCGDRGYCGRAAPVLSVSA